MRILTDSELEAVAGGLSITATSSLSVATSASTTVTEMSAYRFYRLANEKAIVTAAQENTLRGMPSIKALASALATSSSSSAILVLSVSSVSIS